MQEPAPAKAGEIDERVHAFLDRPLAGEWPYLWLDATYLKQREGGRIVSVAAIIAVAANTDGRREIVGLHIGPSEAETFWSTFLKSLARRGLHGVKLVISDAEGLKAATRRVFGAGWQRCRVHWMRNALAYVPKTQQSMVAAALRQAFLQPDRPQASAMLRHLADQFRQKWPKLAAFIDDSETEVLSYLDFPEPHRSKLHSTDEIDKSFFRWLASHVGTGWSCGTARAASSVRRRHGAKRLQSAVALEGAAALFKAKWLDRALPAQDSIWCV